ncbi:muconolactone Delta-isomerase family protein [Actinomadura luteofluorescens]|uniref:Muconolactone delta-isomerase n=1 Tax=Actinomadura luteofluorescens TaxID=46163 RepID=A0A7Y9JK51_9ACTN|nr:muconolactone Delta-isomerase family protein [Actinomadura luteofluorescens]NYD51940.1 muconolactone delta-isomerase [Actinomadura luteofluorescens]
MKHEYLVTMTTRVPDGTPAREVDDIRAREAANTSVLAAQGRVLRLWRPPLGPGEWRTIGLFTADGPDDLERTLAAMPLRVWRTDQITALDPHPNDPGRGKVPLAAAGGEYLVTFTVEVPDATTPQARDEMFAREAARARELAAEGRLLRLWSLPGEGRNLGLFQAADAKLMQEILRSLPLAAWFTTETVPLTRHPSDP